MFFPQARNEQDTVVVRVVTTRLLKTFLKIKTQTINFLDKSAQYEEDSLNIITVYSFYVGRPLYFEINYLDSVIYRNS